MENHHYNSDFFIPGLELISLTDEYDAIDSSSGSHGYLDRDEPPTVDWIEDCQVQENLFQIIPLAPEETRCDENNHIIKPDANVFFEELGYICDDPEPIDPGRDYEAEYKQEQQQKYNSTDSNNNNKNTRRRQQRQRQHHVDLESMPPPPPTVINRHGTMETFSSPGLSSSSSSFYHTDDDEDNIKSTGRMPHVNHHHALLHHHHPHHPYNHHNHYHHPHAHHPQPSSTISKPTVTSSHFSFNSVRF